MSAVVGSRWPPKRNDPGVARAGPVADRAGKDHEHNRAPVGHSDNAA